MATVYSYTRLVECYVSNMIYIVYNIYIYCGVLSMLYCNYWCGTCYFGLEYGLQCEKVDALQVACHDDPFCLEQ